MLLTHLIGGHAPLDERPRTTGTAVPVPSLGWDPVSAVQVWHLILKTKVGSLLTACDATTHSD